MYKFKTSRDQQQSTLLTLSAHQSLIVVKASRLQVTHQVQAQSKLLLQFIIHENHDESSNWSALEHSLQEKFSDVVAGDLVPFCQLKIHVYILHSGLHVNVRVFSWSRPSPMLFGAVFCCMECLCDAQFFTFSGGRKKKRDNVCLTSTAQPESYHPNPTASSLLPPRPNANPSKNRQQPSLVNNGHADTLNYNFKNVFQLITFYILLMKKSYDWNIKLFIEANHKTIEIVASVHTNIHKLKIEIAKQLGLSVLDSHIDLVYNGRVMKATSTLLQNQVPNFGRLNASVARHKLANSEMFRELQKTVKKEKDTSKKEVKSEGLSIVCSCTNNRCVNYNQDIQVEYGFGVFPILELTAFTKCEFCPYKSQFLRPSMLCKEVKVGSCYLRLRGSELDKGGIPIQKDSGFTKITQQKDIRTFLQERPWHINMQLHVKHL